MERSRIGIRIVLGLAAILCAVGGAVAQDEPLEAVDMRGLRSDYVKSWYIYSDVNRDGVLNLGDTREAGMENWWTAIDSPAQAKQHDDSLAGYNFSDTNKPMTPLNFASAGGSGLTDYWLDKPKANRLGFYMTYSQWDNASAGWHAGLNNGSIAGFGEYNAEQAADRGGWALGWVNDAIWRSASGGVVDNENVKGYNYMDIYVHNGRYSGDVPTFPDTGGYGKHSDSNPHVGMSNGINEDSLDPETNTRFVPMYDNATYAYTAAANEERDQWYQNVQAHYGDPVTGFDLASVMGTMEVREVDPYQLQGEVWAALCNTDDTAFNIALNTGYQYQDAMIGRSDYTYNSTSGGMINGLASRTTGTEYDEQQVIRIDLADFNTTYLEAGITPGVDENGNPLSIFDRINTVDEIMFYDFGYDPTAGQVVPIEILFRVDHARTYDQGQVWLDVDGDGVFDAVDGDCYFAENRIFIGLMDPVPEPTTMVLLAGGTIGLLLKRRKNRRGK